MKHYLLTGLALLCFKLNFAQQFPAYLYEDVAYAYSSPNFPDLIVSDSNVYTVRSGGLQIVNKFTGQIDYRWAGWYPLKTIAPDSAGRFIFLKDSSRFIGRLNTQTGQFQNIADSSFQSFSSITQIGSSPDYRVWAIAGNKLSVFNGLNWQWFPLSFTPVKLMVANDSIAYLTDSLSNIYCFNNGLTSFIYRSGFLDWATAPNSNLLCLTRSDSLILIQGNTVVKFGREVTGYGEIIHVKLTTSGHVLVAGYYPPVYDYNGGQWDTLTLSTEYIRDLVLDRADRVCVLGLSQNSTDSLYIRTGTGWDAIDFRFYPYRNLKAITLNNDGKQKIATAEGLFYVGYDMSPIMFFDTNSLVYANDITCFTVSETNQFNLSPTGWGTHHGVFGLNINNGLLPDTNINYILEKNGTYYICTDKGLCIYNQSTYTTYDTSNSPLPSQKITFATIDYAGRLFLGTAGGIAIYGSWQVFDTSNVHVSSFYVTGILTGPIYHNGVNNDAWVTTLGGGLILLNLNGACDLLNTQNGLLKDDSLYYVKHIESCGVERVIGTKHHGIAYVPDWPQDSILYLQYYVGYFINDSIRESTAASVVYQGTSYMMATQEGIFYGGMCEDIQELPTSKFHLQWFTEGNYLRVFVPDDFTAIGHITLTDVLGRNLLSRDEQLQPGQTIEIDTRNFPKAFYVLQLSATGKQAVAKVVLR